MHKFNPQALKWDLFWKLPTPLGGVNRHFTNWSSRFFSKAKLRPNTRWLRRAAGLLRQTEPQAGEHPMQMSRILKNLCWVLKLERKAGIVSSTINIILNNSNSLSKGYLTQAYVDNKSKSHNPSMSHPKKSQTRTRLWVLTFKHQFSFSVFLSTCF